MYHERSSILCGIWGPWNVSVNFNAKYCSQACLCVNLVCVCVVILELCRITATYWPWYISTCTGPEQDIGRTMHILLSLMDDIEDVLRLCRTAPPFCSMPKYSATGSPSDTSSPSFSYSPSHNTTASSPTYMSSASDFTATPGIYLPHHYLEREKAFR